MTTELAVLRALLRLSRRRGPATIEELVTRVAADSTSVVRALGVLARAGLVQRTAAGPRLSLPGLAVAVAAASQAKTQTRKRRSARASIVARPNLAPLVRRRRAA